MELEAQLPVRPEIGRHGVVVSSSFALAAVQTTSTAAARRKGFTTEDAARAYARNPIEEKAYHGFHGLHGFHGSEIWIQKASNPCNQWNPWLSFDEV